MCNYNSGVCIAAEETSAQRSGEMSAERSGGLSSLPAPEGSLSATRLPPEMPLEGALSAAQVADIDKLFDSLVPHYNDTPPQPPPPAMQGTQPGARDMLAGTVHHFSSFAK